MSEVAVPPRKEARKEYTWNAESVYPTKEAWADELKAIQDKLAELSKHKGNLAQSADTLSSALQMRDNLLKRTATVTMYAQMHQQVDNTDQEAAAMVGKAQSLYGQVAAAVAFIEPEVVAIGQATIQSWMEKTAGLKIYAHYFDDLFRSQAHVRSAEVEEILGMLADPFSNTSNTAGMLTDADFKFRNAISSEKTEVEVTQGSYAFKIMSSSDRELRRSAWESYTDQHLAYKNTLTSNLNTSLKQNIFNMHARKHDSTLEASLFNNNIPTAVFHNLLETFRKHLPTWHRYFALRKKVLGVEDLHVFDMWAPLSKERPKVTYHQAVEWICEGLKPMGKEYVETVRKGCTEQRWVDVYPNLGKFSGAFSYGAPGTYPFIVMSFSDEIFSLSTLAHELGHSMHSYLTWQNQPMIYSFYSLFAAEVASNFHQAMVRGYLLENSSDESLTAALLEEAMANYYRYFFTMPNLARFELEVHQRVERGEGLSADGLIDLMAGILQEAYGPAVDMRVSAIRQRYGITWATFSHLYSDYYVYQYATGISGANALARRILSKAPNAVEDYLKFLKSGSSMYPLDALKMAGVDLTTPQPVEDAFAVMGTYIAKLEQLVG